MSGTAQQAIVIVAADTSVRIRHPASGFPADAMAAALGSDAYIVAEADLPRQPAFRSAWRWISGAVTVDMPAARALRTAALLATAAELSAYIDKLALSHMVDGNAAEVATLRTLKATLTSDAKSDLGGIADLGQLAAYEPASFAAVRAALAS